MRNGERRNKPVILEETRLISTAQEFIAIGACT